MLYGKRGFSEALTVIGDIVFPRRCPVCDDAVAPPGGDVCGACENKIKPFAGIPGTEHRMYGSLFTVFSYRSASPSLYRFKYMGRREYASWYARKFVQRNGPVLRDLGIEALIPVPMHAKKERLRGYNQAKVFADALSGLLKTPVINDLVIRVKDTKPLKNLDYHGRRNNLKNAFIMRRNDVKYKSVALVDDIFTTGSTADEIASLLQKNGIPAVYVFTVAVTQSEKGQ